MGLRRLLVICWIICHYRLDTLIPAEKLPLRARLLLRLGPGDYFHAGILAAANDCVAHSKTSAQYLLNSAKFSPLGGTYLPTTFPKN